jgi:DNA-binding transcriptional LysR family regulator
MLNENDLSRTDLNLLVLFEAVMQERHVGRAAERLHLTPSAVSHGLNRLRALLGDPLFVKVPRGVTPTARAIAIDPLVRPILAQMRALLATAAPFDPARSTRRFVVAAPDGVAAVFLPALLDRLSASAPGIGLGVRNLLPRRDEPVPERAWRDVHDALDTGEVDIAVVPHDHLPARFATRPLGEERFVIALRNGHPAAAGLSLSAYADARHLVVSQSGDPFGFVDTALAGHGLTRRVALTVPNFMGALPVLAGTDMVAALPERFLALHGARFGLVAVAPPLSVPGFRLTLVAPRAALGDAGLAWMFAQVR